MKRIYIYRECRVLKVFGGGDGWMRGLFFRIWLVIIVERGEVSKVLEWMWCGYKMLVLVLFVLGDCYFFMF